MKRQRFGWNVEDLTIGNVVAEMARRNGDKPYLRFLPDGRSFTYRDIDESSNRLANGLLAAGIGKGSHVAIMMENSPEHLLTLFALTKIGAVCIPINTAARGELLAYYLRQSDSTAVVADAACADRLMEVRSRVEGLETIVSNPGASGDAPTDSQTVVDFRDAARNGNTRVPETGVRFSDVGFIFYTSGTTGPSKGVLYTHAQTLLWGLDTAEHRGNRYTDTMYVCLPLFHMNGFPSCIGSLLVGASVALARRFSASQFWSDIRFSGATTTNLLGSMTNILWAAEPSPEDRNHRLRLVNMTPVAPFALAFEERFGLRICAGYGLTDFGVATEFSITDPPSKLGTAGRARRGKQVRIVDENDFEMPPNQPGEIVLRSDFTWDTSPGYYKMPEATLQANRNGWFHTGDRAFLDDDGYLHFVDRKKDSIRRRGENISTWEVEQVIRSHPAVAEAAVFAVKSDMSEDEVAASIVLRSGEVVSEEEMARFCGENMAYFMVPRYIQYLNDLPRTETQKVEKFKLKETAERDRGSLWDRERSGIVLPR